MKLPEINNKEVSVSNGEEITATTIVTIMMNVTELCDSMDIPAVVGPTEVNYTKFPSSLLFSH